MMDIKKLERQAKKKEKENYRFRVFLKCNADPDELDCQFKALHSKLFSEYDCSQCRNCCKKYCGLIPAEDIPADAEYLGISQNAFMKIFLKAEPSFDGYETISKPCDFLKDGECLLGQYKPDACKDFPYTDREDRIGSLLSIIENTAVCPVVYEIMEQLKKIYRFK